MNTAPVERSANEMYADEHSATLLPHVVQPASKPQPRAALGGQESDQEGDQARAILAAGEAAHQHGHFEQASDLLNRAARLFELRGDPAGHLKAEQLLGRAQRDLGNFGAAAEHLEQAYSLARALHDAEAEADILNLQASVRSAAGEPHEALDLLRSALRLARRLELKEREANLLNNVGELHRLLGQFPLALESLRAAYDLYKTLPDGRGAVVNLVCLGNLYKEMDNLKESRHLFGRALKAGREADDLLVEATALNNLANLDLKDGALQSALSRFGAALDIARTLGAKQYEVDNLDGLGQVYVALGDHSAAAEVHRTSHAVATEIGDREGELDALLNLGRDHLAVRDAAAATRVLREALELATKLERQTSVYRTHELLAAALELAGDFSGALAHHKAFYKAEKTVFNEANERRTWQLSVQFELERARHEAEEYRLRTRVKQEALEEAEATVRERTRELEEAQLEIVTRLAVAAEYRDDDTGEHTRRVGRNAAALAHALGWDKAEVQLLFTAARLHDVGKIGIPDSVLLKPGKLDWSEMELMRTHTRIGALILSAGHSRLLRMAEEIALAHHERFDGRGYPLGLVGDAIPLSARIVAVADVLDALAHERPYKQAWRVEDALAEIARQAGQQFDPVVVAACQRLFGPGGNLSPADGSADWLETWHTLQTV